MGRHVHPPMLQSAARPPPPPDMPDARPAVVVVPLYTTALPPDEHTALARNLRMLRRHPVAVVCPAGLDLAPLAAALEPAQPRVEHFPDACFDGMAGYNRMLLSEAFYARFAGFRHLLVCQTDAFVFRDALAHWCAQDWDYVGAPWIASPRTAFNTALFRLNSLFRRKHKHDDYLFRVGNGGFSLRKVDTLLRIMREQRAHIDHLLAHPRDDDHHIEDRYVSLVAPTRLPGMRIPHYAEAVDFCIDRRPALALPMNGGRLPFACHGFNKRNVRAFWAPILERALAEEAAA